MKRSLAVLCFFVCSLPAFSQNWSTVSASNITDLNQNKLAAGQLCFLVTDQSDNPISVSVGGGGQTLKRPFCSAVTVGAVTAFTVPNPANTQPSGIYYRVTVKDTSTGLEVLRYTQVTFSGATFNFDVYAPTNLGNFAPLTGTSVSGNLSVSGNQTITGSSTAASYTAGGAGQFGGGLKSTSLTTAGNGNSVTLLNVQGPAAAITGNGSAQVFYTYTIPANTVGQGKCFDLKVNWSHLTGSAAISYSLSLGGVAIQNATITDTGFQEYMENQVCNLPGSQTSQALRGYSLRAGLWFTYASTVAVNMANSQVVQITFNVANTDQITPTMWTVELSQ
jgi:hypothetical protein